jgi:hypothetical protein
MSILRFLLWPGLLTYIILDPIMLSNNKSAGAESKTDYSDLNADVTEKSDSDPPHVIDSNIADGDSSGSGVTLISDRLATNY